MNETRVRERGKVREEEGSRIEEPEDGNVRGSASFVELLGGEPGVEHWRKNVSGVWTRSNALEEEKMLTCVVVSEDL